MTSDLAAHILATTNELRARRRKQTLMDEAEPVLLICSSYDQFLNLWQTLLNQKEVDDDDGSDTISHQLSRME